MMNRSHVVFAAAIGLALTAFARVDTNGKNITVSGQDAVAVDGKLILSVAKPGVLVIVR